MERKLKFRAWDKKNKVMCIPEFQASFNEGQYPVNQLFSGELDNNNFIWMQYTGLKDKNGKEIYEGDIIYLENFRKGEVFEETFIVEFDHSSFCLAITKANNVLEKGERMSFGFTEDNNNQLLNEEIIGNIFENKVLDK